MGSRGKLSGEAGWCYELSKEMVHFGCLVPCVLAWHAGHAELCCDF